MVLYQLSYVRMWCKPGIAWLYHSNKLPCFGGRYWDRTSDLFRVREARYRCANRPLNPKNPETMVFTEVGTGFEPVYTALQAAASPLGQPTVLASIPKNVCCDSVLRADDEIRTRDIHLGKVVLYQLSYVRILEG